MADIIPLELGTTVQVLDSSYLDKEVVGKIGVIIARLNPQRYLKDYSLEMEVVYVVEFNYDSILFSGAGVRFDRKKWQGEMSASGRAYPFAHFEMLPLNLSQTKAEI